MKAYVITVGNEILKGRTINTNAAHIGRVLTYAGYDVIRMVVVPDDIDEIVWAFRDGISRADLVVSTGGLGPTFDDKTVEGLAKALNLELELNQEAYSMVKGKYDRLGVELTRERVKTLTPCLYLSISIVLPFSSCDSWFATLVFRSTAMPLISRPLFWA